MTRPTFIDCDRLDLVPPGEGDLPFLLEGVNHPDVRQYIGLFRRPFTEERYREELWPVDAGEDGVTLLAVPNEGEHADEPVGSVQLYPIQETDANANFGVWFHPDAWGTGFALEASAHLFDHAFRQLGLHRISATAAAPNDASKRLCERLGFVHEGVARESQFVDGAYVDVVRYGLLVDEWEGPDAVLDR